MLAVVQTREAEDGAAVFANTLVSQAEHELVASLSQVPVRLSGVHPLSGQDGYQLFEGGVWELVKKVLKAGVSPDLLPQMAIPLEKGHQLLDDQLPRFTGSIRQRPPFWLVASVLGMRC